jgi:hypothetical protein
MTPNGKGGDPQSQADAGGLMEKGGGPSIADRRCQSDASQTGLIEKVRRSHLQPATVPDDANGSVRAVADTRTDGLPLQPNCRAAPNGI